MRVKCLDDKLIVYQKDATTSNLEELCRNIINKLKKYYNIDLKGFYNVNIFEDKDYGVVIEFILEDIDFYYDYSKVDLHIIKKEVTFLYQATDLLNLSSNYGYYYHNQYYIKVKDMELSDWDFGELVYQNTDEIITNGKIIKCKFA